MSSLSPSLVATIVLSTGLILAAPPSGTSTARPVAQVKQLVARDSVPAAQAAPTKYRHVVRASITTKRTDSKVTLVVREYRAGRVVQTLRKPVLLAADDVTRVRMVVRTQQTEPRLTLRMRTPALASGDVFLLKNVRWTQIDAPAGDGQPTPAGTLSNGCSYSTRGIPACGAYLGQAYGSNTDPSDFENRLGQRLGVRRTYFTGTQVDSAVSIARQDLANGRLPWVSFKLPYSWSDMANGRGDDWARNLTDQFGQLQGPVWLAFHHEPEGDGNIDDWRRMQEHLAPIIRAENNLAFTVIVTGYNQFYGDEQYRLDNIWPRGVKVDLAGFDIYNQLGVVRDGKENTVGTDLKASYFSKIAPWARDQGIAWGLAETGITNTGADQIPGWIERTHSQLEAAGGVAFAYFNTTLNSIAPWDLSTQVKLDGWRQAQLDTPLLPRG